MTKLSLSGTYIVTGPAKGMGPAIICAIAEAGGDLVLAARDREALEVAAAEVEARGCKSLVVPTDITDETSVAAMVSAGLEAGGGRVAGLVNVAGVPGPEGRRLWEHTVTDYRCIFDANVLGTILPMKHVLPLLIAQRAGSIVNIGGTFGFKGVRGASIYGASKWALRGITKSAALEVGDAGVRVNMVSPGGVEGPRLTRSLTGAAERTGSTFDETFARFAATSALGRVSAAEDVAASVVFLLSEAARMITGQDLLVDGGTIV